MYFQKFVLISSWRQFTTSFGLRQQIGHSEATTVGTRRDQQTVRSLVGGFAVAHGSVNEGAGDRVNCMQFLTIVCLSCERVINPEARIAFEAFNLFLTCHVFDNIMQVWSRFAPWTFYASTSGICRWIEFFLHPLL